MLFFPVSFQPSITISTLQSFERTPILPPQQQQQHKQQHKQQHVHKTPDNGTPVNTGSSNNNEDPTNVEPTSPTTVGESDQHAMDNKNTSKEPVTTPSKEAEMSTVSPPLSPTDVESSKKSLKTLPAKSSEAEERKTLFATSKGKSEKKHTPEKRKISATATSPTRTTHPAIVTPEKGKTPTKEVAPSSDQQHKTPQDDNTEVIPSSPTSTSAGNTPVKPEPHHKDVHTPTANTRESGDQHKDAAEIKETEQPLSPGSDDFVVIDLPSSDDLVDTDTTPVEVPVSEYFPVSHVILNSVDWSLTVANVGLCVMIYSFQPSKPYTAIKVCM